MRKLMLGMFLAAGATLPGLVATAAAAAATQDRPPEAERHHGGPGGEHPRDQGARAEQPRPAAQPPVQQARPQPAPTSAPQAQAQVRADGRGDRGRWGGDGAVRADAAARAGDGNRFGGARVQADERVRFGNGDQRRFDDVHRQPPPGAAFGNNRPAPPPSQQLQGFRGAQGTPGGYRPNGYAQDGYRADAYGRAPQYRPGTGAQNQYRGGGNWSRGWRNDRRYDWGGYRAQNRSAFHLPRYYAPRGWGYGYRRFSPGLTLFAGLFAEEFWIDDAYDYRLPPAYGPYRWVRYYNDALLVDIRTGYVVDTVYDIFW